MGCTECCPWFTPTSGEFLECNDKSTCDLGSSEGWFCCKGRGGRAKCPASMPIMCAARDCGGMDYCCVEKEKGCEVTNRKCQDYGELVCGDPPFRPKMK